MGQKSILIIGSRHSASLELLYHDGFTKLGIRSHILGIQEIFLEYYNKSLFNKIIYRLGFHMIITRIQDVIWSEIVQFMPDIVIVFKGMEVKPRTIKLIKSSGIKIVNYNPDNPFIFSGRGSGNRNVKKSIRLYDIYFTYDNDIMKRLIDCGVRSELIPFGFDNYGFDYRVLSECEEINEICFLGNADEYRVAFLNELARKGFNLVVYGGNWMDFDLHPNIQSNGLKYGVEFYEVLRSYVIQLNLLRPHNRNSHNMRSFDIPGAGGIMLAPNTPDHSKFFEEGIEIFLFSNIDDAISKIQLISNLVFEERSKMREAARNRVLRDHTYSARIDQLLEYLL